jgi:hypothetical protein
MCTLTQLQSQWLMSIEEDRNLYLKSATVTLVNVYGTGQLCVYLNTATDTQFNNYRKGPVCVYPNSATVTLVTAYRTGPVCVT